MKKYITICIVAMLIFALPITCNATTINPSNATLCSDGKQIMLASGYTDEGIYYEVYGEQITINPNTRHDIEIERTVVFTGRIMPPQTLDWEELIGVYIYRGNLQLISFYYDAANNKTTGIYSGIVTN